MGVYGAVDVVLFVIAGIWGGKDQNRHDPIDTVIGVVAVALVITACAHLRSVRREVYGVPATPPPVDPAIAQVLAARTRRTDARALAERDPLMARELGIGRPDLPGDYDDGGLVDLGSAPASVLAASLGLSEVEAGQIVDAQGSFGSVDELLVRVELPLSAWERIRDRGIVIQA
ncbi:hypothetical protein [Actinokineospora sp. NBRC 105648]|uniref:hypothetical protein n=1 Tax=Actinokineospora sp. NBRC 105648 TaxID=3032206 RepID=UPI0025539B9F|nr:hypothetical protein [Actinokineospora sp. NBRC 105648]